MQVPAKIVFLGLFQRFFHDMIYTNKDLRDNLTKAEYHIVQKKLESWHYTYSSNSNPAFDKRSRKWFERYAETVGSFL